MTPRASGCVLALLLSLLQSPSFSWGQESLPLVEGDVTLATIFSVNNIKDVNDCGDYDIDTLKELVAVQWFLKNVNNMRYIPGVQLGLEAYRSCQSGERATRSAVNMLEKYHVLEDGTQDLNTTKPLLGILGPGRTQEAIMVSRFLSSLPSSQRPLIISGSTTGAALTDRALYSNFYRVIPPDSTQVQVLLKLLQALGWNYISIVYDDDAYGREAAEQLRDLVQGLDLCVPSFAALPLNYRSATFIEATNRIIDRLRGGDSSFIKGVVFIGSVATAQDFVTRLAAKVSFVRFIFSEALGLQSSVVSGAGAIGKGALAAAPPSLPLPEFRTFWNSLWTNRTTFSAEVQINPWLGSYYTAATKCEIDNVNCWNNVQGILPLIQDDTQWLFEYYQVKAAAVFVEILKRLHSETCGNNDHSVCLQLKQLLRNNRERIQNVLDSSSISLHEFSSLSSTFTNQTNIRFSDQGEIITGGKNDSLYDVFNYRDCDNGNFCFQKVGSYEVGGSLVLDTQRLRGYTDDGSPLSWPHFPKAQCADGYDCLACLPADLADDMVFVPGDLYMVAVVAVHDKLPNQPVQCGDIRTSAGADLVQSVLFAVGKVNEGLAPFHNIFGGKRLGVLILNSCSRELVIKEKLIALHKGTLKLPDGRYSSDILPHIAGYLGSFYSYVSVAMYEVLASLHTRFVMLSPSNTSPEMSDRSKYPLYLRLPAGKDIQVTALLTLIQQLGHQYVQVIYDPDDVYSAVFKERLNTLSSQQSFNICVVNNIVSDDEETNYYPVLDNLRKNSWARLVVVLLQARHTRKVMGDILEVMGSSDLYRFVSTDGWARVESILDVPSSSRLLGTLTYSIELPLNQLFGMYMTNTDPLNTNNPWLRYFWEKRKQCYFDGSFQRKDKTGECPAQLTNGYVQDTWVPFYIDSVYAFALGLDSAMTTHCGQASLCDPLTSQHLVDAIRSVRLDLTNSGQKVNVFDDNGDGNVGFKLFQISFDVSTSDPDDMTYVEVGRYERGSLSTDDSLWIADNLPNTVCPNPRACDQCFPASPASPSTPTPAASPSKDGQDDEISPGLIGTIVFIVILVIVVVVLVVLLLIVRRRLAAQNASNNGAEKFAFDNLSASRSGDSRPLPPIQAGAQETGLGSGLGSRSGDTHSQHDAYDYLQHSDGSYPSAGRPAANSYRGYNAADVQPVGPSAGSRGSRSGSHSGGSGHSATVLHPGYVSRDNSYNATADGGRPNGYELAHPPYNRLHGGPSPPPPVQSMERDRGFGSDSQGGQRNSRAEDWPRGEGGRQNNRVDDWPQEGGRQNSRVDDWPQEGGRQNSRMDDWPHEGGRQNSRMDDWPQEGGRQNSRMDDWPQEGGRQNSRMDGWPQEGGRQNSRMDDWPQEGGRQNSRMDDRPQEGARPYSLLGDSHVGVGRSAVGGSPSAPAPPPPRPVEFENAEAADSNGPPLPAPEVCRSSDSSGYLTPLGEDYLTPRPHKQPPHKEEAL